MITFESAGYDTLDPKVAEKIFSDLKEIGFDAVEPIGFPEKTDHIKQIGELLSSFQLKSAMIAGVWGRFGSLSTFPDKDPTSSDQKRRDSSVEYVKKCSDIAVSLGSNYVQLTLGPIGQRDLTDLGINRARENLLEVIRRSASHARDAGVELVFEPQCRFEGYYGVNTTVEQSLELIEESREDNVMLMVDTFHANIEEVSITQAIAIAGRKLKHVHLADNNRLPPGMGAIDFKPIIRELSSIGYDGYLGMECIPIGLGPELRLRRGLDYLKRIERKL